MEKKMENEMETREYIYIYGLLGFILGLYWDNGKSKWKLLFRV